MSCGQVADTGPLAVDDTQCVGADRARDLGARLDIERVGDEDAREQRGERPLRRNPARRTCPVVAVLDGLRPSALRRVHDREVVGRLEGEQREDRAELLLEAFDRPSTEASPPPLLNQRRKGAPHRLGALTPFPQAHRGAVLGRVLQGLIGRRDDLHVAPTPQSVEQEPRGPCPAAQLVHAQRTGAEVLHDVGRQGERHQPGPFGGLARREVVPGLPVGEPLLRLVVQLDRVRHQRLPQQPGEGGRHHDVDMLAPGIGSPPWSSEPAMRGPGTPARWSRSIVEIG